MPEHETERFHIAQSMDDLMIRTIGLIETLPDRLSKLETSVQQLDKGFSHHCGEQEQGIKRTIDRVDRLKDDIKNLQEKIKGCNVGADVKKLGDAVAIIEHDVEKLLEDLKEREETQKTISQYIKAALTSFIRYAMLPITIIVLILFGMDPSYIPWYTAPKPISVPAVQEKTGVEYLWCRVYMNSIGERDITFIINKFSPEIIVSRQKNSTLAEKEYRSQLIKTNIINKTHMFIWLPSDEQEGSVQVFNKHGLKIGNTVRIIRGI